jgi:hypothetical protein
VSLRRNVQDFARGSTFSEHQKPTALDVFVGSGFVRVGLASHLESGTHRPVRRARPAHGCRRGVRIPRFSGDFVQGVPPPSAGRRHGARFLNSLTLPRNIAGYRRIPAAGARSFVQPGAPPCTAATLRPAASIRGRAREGEKVERFGANQPHQITNQSYGKHKAQLSAGAFGALRAVDGALRGNHRP